MRKARWGLALLMLPLMSCFVFRNTKYDRQNYPPNPWPGIEGVLVLPFIDQTGNRIDAIDMANICANEVVKFPGFRVYRPVDAGFGERTEWEPTAENAMALARKAGADAVLVVAVTDYDPYDPPRLSVRTMMLNLSPQNISGPDIDRLTQSAQWRMLPVPLKRRQAGNFIGAFDDVYDARAVTVREELAKYADAQEYGGMSGFKDIREFTMVQSRFVQFVSCQILWRLIQENP